MSVITDEVIVDAAGIQLEGNLSVPQNANGIVIFAHGSGSSRFSSRNRYVAQVLRDGGVGTLLIDLLTAQEEAIDVRTRHLRFDIELLAKRLVGAAEWLGPQKRIGYFGASTGGGAALVAAARIPDRIGAVVSRGGRPDLAGSALPRVKAPTLLIVGGDDAGVIELNEEAYDQLTCEKQMVLVPHATHLFEEPGTLEEVARMARDWFQRYLRK